MRLTTYKIALLLAFLRSLLGVDGAVDCDNSNFSLVRLPGRFLPRFCRFVRRNDEVCEEIDGRTENKVGLVCAKECPSVSHCDGSTELPASSSPTPSPTSPPAPTDGGSGVGLPPPPGPDTSPTPSPISSTLPPTSAPVSCGVEDLNYDPYPEGPYITVKKASELITLAEPPEASVSTAQSNCPHDSSGLLKWHQPSTWPSGAIPAAGQAVTLPTGSRVLIDQTVAGTLGVVTIPVDSELIIGQNENGINIDAAGFLVRGKLTAGSETCRILTPITITLHGTRPADAVRNIPTETRKGISVEGGILSLHGKRYFHTWSRLAKTVEAGDSVLMLQHSVNWEPGQQVVITTASMKDSRDYNHNDVRTIKEVNYNPCVNVGAIVYLTEPVQYRHTAISNYQVEVGLLTRTIKIQGDPENSEATDPDPGTCRDPQADNKWYVWFNNSYPCMDKELTGYGGHIMIHSDGVGQVEGVELYRMGQTNVKMRYPIHFHLLGDCPSCYFKDSSVHRSFYRCIAIHGTNEMLASENVAYDVIGYCYYLEDGVEENNTLSYNLAALIHTIGPELPRSVIGGQHIKEIYVESDTLTLPADVTASGFYITNVRNNIIGNAASGGYSGFAFPNLKTGLQSFRSMAFKPINVEGLKIDGNTAHSSSWWWNAGGAFYLGGALYYNSLDKLEYDPGRNKAFDQRNPCKINTCKGPDDCSVCPSQHRAWLRVTNTKAFLTAGAGFNSWSGRIELINYEAHDVGLVAFIITVNAGSFLKNLLGVCRTGEDFDLPSPKGNLLKGQGFSWYDTNQEHVVADVTFRNCGYRTDEYKQYDTSPDRGCGDGLGNGCRPNDSTVFLIQTNNNGFAPELMQASRGVKFENCGRRFLFDGEEMETGAGRNHNWLDTDGSVSGFGEQSLILAGYQSIKDWTQADDEVVYDTEGPLAFIKKNNGPQRNVATMNILFDETLRSKVNKEICGFRDLFPCPFEAYIRHAGPRYSPFKNPGTVKEGFPVTGEGSVAGLTGGFGWILTFNSKAPRSIRFKTPEIDPSSPLILSIPYPVGTQFVITAKAGSCWRGEPDKYSCEETYVAVSSIDEVRFGAGNTYHVDGNGVLTLRVIQFSNNFIGTPNFIIPEYTTPGRHPDQNEFAIEQFQRDGMFLPGRNPSELVIQAKCPSDTSTSPTNGYCNESFKSNYDREVCDTGYDQVAYDRCCQRADLTKCIFADGSRNF